MKYRSQFGRDLIEDWLRRLPVGENKGVRIEMEAILRHLRFLKAESWGRPQFSYLQGDHCKGIGELIFEYRGVAYRPLGFFGPEPDQFSLLIGARKDRKRKGKVQWEPENAVETAVRCMKELVNGVADTVEYVL